MRMQDAVGEDELDMRRVGAARRPSLQFEVERVGNEVRLPHMFAGAYGNEGPLALEMARIALASGKGRRVLEDEMLAAEQVIDGRHVAADGEARRLLSGRVEELVSQVQRRREDGTRSPFEAVLCPVVAFDAGAAV